MLDLIVHVAAETDEQNADDQALRDDTRLNDVDTGLEAGALLAVVEDGVADDAEETGNAGSKQGILSDSAQESSLSGCCFQVGHLESLLESVLSYEKIVV